MAKVQGHRVLLQHELIPGGYSVFPMGLNCPPGKPLISEHHYSTLQ